MCEADLIRIGTSGWHYRHWQGPYYPVGLAPRDYLRYYCRDFNTVEINNSFYALPSEDTLAKWRESVPQDFRFSTKASRFITHMKKLKEVRAPLDNYLQRMQSLNDRLGPVLFQMPPNWHANVPRLVEFMDILPEKGEYAFEFRHPSWLIEAVYAALEDHQNAFCIYDMSGKTSPKVVSADFDYLRLHGPGPAYQGKYSRAQLGGWAGDITDWVGQGKRVYCYFNNDPDGNAVHNAIELKGLLGV